MNGRILCVGSVAVGERLPPVRAAGAQRQKCILAAIMVRIIRFGLLLFGWWPFAAAAALPLDSLHALFRHPATPDTQRVRILIEISHREPTLDQALVRSREALRLARRTGFPRFEMIALDNLFVAYARAGDPAAALQTAHQLLAQAQRQHDADYEAFANLDIAGILDQQHNKAEAEHYYRLALRKAQEPGVKPRNLATIEQEWGSFLQDAGRYAECRQVVEHALGIYSRLGYAVAQGICLSVLADVALAEKKYAAAAAYARQALALVEQAHTSDVSYPTDLLATSNNILMITQRAAGDLPAALRYGEKALFYARQIGVRQMQAHVLPELIRTYAQSGNYAAAYRLQDSLLVLRDTIYSETKAAEVNRLQTEFETAKKQQEIRALTQRTRIQQLEVDRARSRNRLLATGSLALLALLVGGGGLYWQLSRSRRQLALSEAALRRSNHTKDLLMSIVGHDLRGPVAAFQQLAPMLRHYARRPAPDELHELADELEAGTGRLGALLDNLLHWARLQADSVVNHPDTLAIEPLVNDVVSLYRPTATAKHVELLSSVATDLPLAWADRDLLATVLRNLVSNAVKFTPSGGHVTIWYRVENRDAIAIGVRDTGLGLTPDQLARLIEPGARKSTVGTAGEQGTGLGLAVCQSFVELLGGELVVESQPQQGTECRFTIPAVSVAESV